MLKYKQIPPINPVGSSRYGILILLGTLINLASYRSSMGGVVSPLPSAQQIGRGYLRAVIRANVGYMHEHSEDSACIRQKLRRETGQYGSAEIQNTVLRCIASNLAQTTRLVFSAEFQTHR